MKELKQLMKDVVLHNIGIKVLSLIGALFVWLISRTPRLRSRPLLRK